MNTFSLAANILNAKLIIEYMRKLVRKSYTPVVPIANTCSIGYPHDGRADNAAYRHDRRADNAAYQHDRRADSLSHRYWLLAQRKYEYVNFCFMKCFQFQDNKAKKNNVSGNMPEKKNGR